MNIPTRSDAETEEKVR